MKNFTELLFIVLCYGMIFQTDKTMQKISYVSFSINKSHKFKILIHR